MTRLTDDYWLSSRSNYISARATQKIYNTFGIDPLETRFACRADDATTGSGSPLTINFQP